MPAKRTATPQWRRIANRLALAAGAVALLWFAVEGGEYGTRDLLAQHGRREQLALDVQQLRHEVDSLQKLQKTMLTDNAMLERIAREQYGMLKGNKELLFWMDDEKTQN